MPATTCFSRRESSKVTHDWGFFKARGEQLEDLVIAHSASALSDGAVTLLNRATGGLSSPDVSLAHPSLADKAEWTAAKPL